MGTDSSVLRLANVEVTAQLAPAVTCAPVSATPASPDRGLPRSGARGVDAETRRARGRPARARAGRRRPSRLSRSACSQTQTTVTSAFRALHRSSRRFRHQAPPEQARGPHVCPGGTITCPRAPARRTCRPPAARPNFPPARRTMSRGLSAAAVMPNPQQRDASHPFGGTQGHILALEGEALLLVVVGLVEALRRARA